MTETTVAAPRSSSRLPRSPYKGLLPYTEEDTPFFFGRETERELIAANLMAARLTVVYGPSGVGKTSVLDAGVAHDVEELAREALEEEDTPAIAVVVFRTWHREPTVGLAAAVAASVRQLLPQVEADDPSPETDLADVLEHWAGVLGGRLLVILDQFEEYFVYSTPGDRFDEEFPRAVNRADLRANFLVSIREDALAKLDRFKGRIPYLFDNYLRVDRLDLEAARSAIEGPLRRWAELGGDPVSIEPELVDKVLEQARPDLSFGQAGTGTADGARSDRVEAPFLQLIMARLWHAEREADSAVLRASTYDRLGGAAGIVRAHLNEGLDQLTQREKRVAAHLFQFLVTRSGQKVALTAVDLADFSELDSDAVETVLDRLSRRDVRILRRVEAGPEDEDVGARYEIFHDTLGEPILAWRSAYFVRMARRRAARWGTAALAALVVAAGCLALLVVTIQAKRAADDAKRSARSQNLVAQATAALATDPNASVRLAQRALAVEPTREAEEALRTAVGSSPLRVVIRHSGGIISAKYSADGRRVLALGAEGTASVSDARTGTRLSTIGYGSPLSSADLSPKGRRVVTAGSDNTVRFWDATTGDQLGSFRNADLVGAWLDPKDSRRAVAVGFAGPVQIWTLGSRRPLRLQPLEAEQPVFAAFSPDGRRIVVRDRSSRVAWIYDAATGRLEHMLKGHTETINDVAWSRDGRRLITGGDDRFIYVWDTATGKPLFSTDNPYEVSVVTFSADGKRIAFAAAKEARVFSATGWRQLNVLRGHGDVVTDIALRTDGREVVTASNDGSARVWDADGGTTLRTLLGSGSVVDTATFSPDDRSVLTGSADGTARRWDVETGRELRRHFGWVLDAAYSPDGRYVLTGGQDEQIALWDARSGRFLGRLPDDPGSAVNSVRFSHDGKLVVTGENGNPDKYPGAVVRGEAVVRRTDTWHPIARITENETPVVAAVFSPRGNEVATAAADGYVGIFDTRTEELRRWLSATPGRAGPAHPLGSATGVAWSDDGRFVVTTATDSLARVWDAASGQRLHTMVGHRGRVTSPSFAPGSHLVVTAGADRTARIWDTDSGHQIAILFGRAPLAAAAFSPNGQLVVTGDAAGVTRVWDWRRRKLLAVLAMHADFVNSVSFSPDGERILSASDDSTAKIYRCETCVPLPQLRELVRKRERIIGTP